MDDLKSTQASNPAASVSAYAPAAPSDAAETNKKRKRRLGLIIGLSVGIPVLVITAIFLITALTPSFVGMDEYVNDTVAAADAHNIAVAVNAYNALNPDADPIDTKEDLVAAADGQDGVLGVLWPENITDLDAAFAMIGFENGVAIIVTPADLSAGFYQYVRRALLCGGAHRFIQL